MGGDNKHFDKIIQGRLKTAEAGLKISSRKTSAKRIRETNLAFKENLNKLEQLTGDELYYAERFPANSKDSESYYFTKRLSYPDPNFEELPNGKSKHEAHVRITREEFEQLKAY